MGRQGHGLEENGRNRNDPAEETAAPLDSGADGGPMDDPTMGPGPTEETPAGISPGRARAAGAV